MRTVRWPLAAGWLLSVAAGCTSVGTPPDVFVLRETVSDGRTCFESCGASPPAALEPDLCPTHTAQCDIVGGWDRLRVITSYGNFALDDDATIPNASVELVVDGQPYATRFDAVLNSERRAESLERFSRADFQVPKLDGKVLVVRTTANGVTTQDSDVLHLSPANVLLSHSRACAPGVPCDVVRATGTVGFTVEAPEAVATAGATLHVKLDGVPQSPVPVTLRRESGRAVGEAPLKVPTEGARWELMASASGLVSQPTVFELSSPDLKLVVTGCFAGTPCHQVRGTGEVEAQLIAAPDFLPEEAAFEARVGGQAFTAITSKKFELRDGVKVARATIKVPDRGTTWQLQAFAAGTRVAADDVTLDDPAIGVSSVDCDQASGCVLEAGVGYLDLVVRAPKDFHDPKVRVLEYQDGVPRPPAEFAYARLNAASEVVISLAVPDSAKQWRIGLETGGETLTPWMIELLPPNVEVRVLECVSDPCVLTAGSTVNVSVSAPAALRNPEVVLEPSLDGVPTGVQATVKLDQIGLDRRSGLTKLTLPAVTETSPWQLFARTGPHRAPGPVIQVDP